jgi:hypothetical protein
MNQDIRDYNEKQVSEDKKIYDRLLEIIIAEFPEVECKIWHAHPVWFLDGNPIVGYHKLKNGIRLLFWSGQSFEEK